MYVTYTYTYGMEWNAMACMEWNVMEWNVMQWNVL